MLHTDIKVIDIFNIGLIKTDLTDIPTSVKKQLIALGWSFTAIETKGKVELKIKDTKYIVSECEAKTYEEALMKGLEQIQDYMIKEKFFDRLKK